MPHSREIVVSSRAADRIAAARAWLEALPSANEVLVIASVKEAADDLVRGFAVSRGAMLGMHRMTMNRLVGLLAAEHIADAGLAPADGLAAEAVAARAGFRPAPTHALAPFAPPLDPPRFSPAPAPTNAGLRWKTNTAGAERDLDETVSVISAPGEMHECVEIARRIAAEARRGVAFDRIAVLLHEPIRYAPYLQEALARAQIPAYFARGTRRPEPGGRALLALLCCAAEDLSARRFAEYLSLAQVPDADRLRDDEPTISPDAELAPAPIESDLEVERDAPLVESTDVSDPVPVIEGTARAPWRWERLLVDAA